MEAHFDLKLSEKLPFSVIHLHNVSAFSPSVNEHTLSPIASRANEL